MATRISNLLKQTLKSRGPNIMHHGRWPVVFSFEKMKGSLPQSLHPLAETLLQNETNGPDMGRSSWECESRHYYLLTPGYRRKVAGRGPLIGSNLIIRDERAGKWTTSGGKKGFQTVLDDCSSWHQALSF